MSYKVFSEILGVVKADEQRRRSLLQEGDPNAAYDQWVFRHEPLLNEICLMLLVTLRHHVERQLVDFAARAVDGGKTISGSDYAARQKQLRRVNKHGKSIGWKWEEIEKRLGLSPNRVGGKNDAVEALRLLANSYKHDPSIEPSEDLKSFLRLPDVAYAPLPESDLVREELGKLIGLVKDAPYWEIVEAYVGIVTDYLEELKGRIPLSKVRWPPARLNPAEFAH